MLTLTHQEAELLRRSLLSFQQLSPQHAPDVRLLLQKLQRALTDDDYNQCAICLTPFSQARAGRDALYCSKSCKQKAYRQRVNQRKRHFGPSQND